MILQNDKYIGSWESSLLLSFPAESFNVKAVLGRKRDSEERKRLEQRVHFTLGFGGRDLSVDAPRILLGVFETGVHHAVGQRVDLDQLVSVWPGEPLAWR